MNYPEKAGYPDRDLKRVQLRLLEMAKCIRNILEKHNYPYMLALGTLLGAVRHHGFIPWDDDFDFFIFDDAYEDVMECLRKELPEKYFLEDERSEPLYFHAWSHVKDLFSEAECDVFPQDSLYAHKGLCIDLYRTKFMEKQHLSRYINQENRLYINRRKEKGLISPEEYAERMRRLTEDEKQVSSEMSGDTTEIYAFLTNYKCKLMYSRDIFPLKKYLFENTEFYGPAKAENILKNIYGDYMNLPPFEKRIPHYSSVKIWE